LIILIFALCEFQNNTMRYRKIASIICIAGFLGCNNGVEVPVSNPITEDSIAKKDSVIDTINTVPLQEDLVVEDDSDEVDFCIGKRVSKNTILKADIRIKEISNFPESLQPAGCKEVYFGVDAGYVEGYNMFYVFYAFENDTFSIAYKVEVEEKKSFLPVTCYLGSYVSYENGILTRECEENSIIYKLHFRIQKNRMVFIDEEYEDPNESLYDEMEKEEDPEKYCSLCYGVQYKDAWWIENCLSTGLNMAVHKAEELIKAGKQEEANRMIQNLEKEHKENIPNDTLWIVLEKMKR